MKKYLPLFAISILTAACGGPGRFASGVADAFPFGAYSFMLQAPDDAAGSGPVAVVKPPVDPERTYDVVSRIVYWPMNRVLDLFDIFRINAGFGPGLGLNLRCTNVLQAGFESHNTLRLGIRRRGPSGWPLVPYYESHLGYWGFLDYVKDGDADRRFWEIGFNIHVFVAGGEVAVDPAEILDFVTSCFFWDIMGDDIFFRTD